MSIISGSCRVSPPETHPLSPPLLHPPSPSHHSRLFPPWRRVNTYIKRQLSYAQFVWECVKFFSLPYVRVYTHVWLYLLGFMCAGARARARVCGVYVCTWMWVIVHHHVCGAMTFSWTCFCPLNPIASALLSTCISYLQPHHLLSPLARFSRLFSLWGKKKRKKQG